MQKNKVDISVVMITYGHEAMIDQAIRSILAQETSLSIEFIIGNDRSPDRTDEIVQKAIAGNTTDVDIRYFNHKQNKGIYKNFAFALDQARGDFIAICEGDDYWNDMHKLQKQYDVISSDPEVAMVFNSSNIESLFDEKIYPEVPAEDRFYSIEELLLTKVAHTASFMFRTSLLATHILTHKDVFGADLVLALSMADQGKVFGMSDYMSTYRKHEGGITHTASTSLGVKHYERFVRQFIYIKRMFPSLSRQAAVLKIVDNCMTIIKLNGMKRPLSSLKYMAIALYYRPELPFKALKKILKIGK